MLEKLEKYMELKRGYDLPSYERENGKYPIITSSGIAEFHNKFKVKGAGVVTGRSGTIGEVFYEERDFWPLNTSLYVKDFKGNNKKFVYYFLKNLDFKHLAGATAVPSLDRKILHNLRVPFLKVNSQDKVVDILSNYDNLIENNNKRIKLLENMAEELYKEWFVRFRFPNYENTKIVDGIPDGWEEKKISDFGKVIIGKTPLTSNEENFNGDIPFIKTPDFKQGLFVVKTEETLSETGANTQKNQFIPKNSICVSCIGTVGEIIITKEKSQTNQQINTVVLNDIKILEYFYFKLKSLKQLIQAYASTGATMGNLSKSKFEQIKLLKPNDELILKFQKVIQPIFNEIEILMNKNQNLKQTRDLLLPRLISGKLDIEDLEIV